MASDVFYGPDTAAALEVCAGCPVREVCAASAVREPWGVWGGTTPEMRGYVNGTRTAKRAARRLARAAA